MIERVSGYFQSMKDVPGSIWAMSTACMLIAISAVMAFSIAPIFMVEILGLSMLSLGMIEGFTEALAQFFRLFSGLTGDYFKKNKPTLMFGFILATISKPLFILAGNVSMVVASKVLERISNGIMATPRDAYVSSAAPEGKRGESLGLMMTMKTVGCTVGSLLVGGMLLFTQNYQFILWIGFAICFVSIFVLFAFVKERTDQYVSKGSKKTDKFNFSNLKQLKSEYWTIIAVSGVFMAARISDGFLILRYKELGGSTAMAASLIGIFNVVSALCCYPIGKYSDSIPRAPLLAFSFIALILCHLSFSFASTTTLGMIGVLLWGAQRGTSQVLFTSIIADVSPREIIGTSLGLFYILTGAMAFASGVIAGKLADTQLSYAFTYGFFVSLAALGFLGVREYWLRRRAVPETIVEKEIKKAA